MIPVFNLSKLISRGLLGPLPYINAKVPTLFTAITTGQDAKNPLVYGNYTNSFILEYGQVIQIVVDNADDGGHPM